MWVALRWALYLGWCAATFECALVDLECAPVDLECAPDEVPLPGKLFKLRGGPQRGGSKRKLLLNKFTATDRRLLLLNLAG